MMRNILLIGALLLGTPKQPSPLEQLVKIINLPYVKQTTSINPVLSTIYCEDEIVKTRERKLSDNFSRDISVRTKADKDTINLSDIQIFRFSGKPYGAPYAVAIGNDGKIHKSFFDLFKWKRDTTKKKYIRTTHSYRIQHKPYSETKMELIDTYTNQTMYTFENRNILTEGFPDVEDKTAREILNRFRKEIVLEDLRYHIRNRSKKPKQK